MQMRLSEGYALAYDRLLQSVAGNGRLRAPFAAFWPQWGHAYSGFMVIGRATNGWSDDDSRGWRPLEASEPRSRGEILQTARRMSESDARCPLLWITDHAGPGRIGGTGSYNTNGSALWRVTKDVVASLYDTGAEPPVWPSLLFWTNLYKIAPSQRGNPSPGCRRTQRPHVCELLRMEVHEVNPQRVLVMTGTDWFEPFREHLAIPLRQADESEYVEGLARVGACSWVVTKRPEYRRQEPFVREVLAAFRGLAPL